MENIKERIDPSMEYMTEYEEWAVNGLKKAEEIICNSDDKTEQKMYKQFQR